MAKLKPKLENADKGFNYTIDPEMFARFQTWTIDERLDWVFETAELVLAHQTPEQRAMMERIKHEKNY